MSGIVIPKSSAGALSKYDCSSKPNALLNLTFTYGTLEEYTDNGL